MRLISKLAVILGIPLFIIACGSENILGIIASVLLISFGTVACIEIDTKKPPVTAITKRR